MAVTAKDALLEAPRTAWAILQHLHVVIGLKDEDVRGVDAVEHQLGGVAEVGGEADVARGGAEQIANRILRVMRNGKGFDQNVGNLKARAGGEQVPFKFGDKISGGFFNPMKKWVAFAVPFFLERPGGGFLGVAVAIDGDF